MKRKRTGGPPRRFWARICALAVIAAMLLTGVAALTAPESGLATENLAAENLAPQSAAPEEGAEADEPEANALAAPAPRAAAHTVTIHAKKILQDASGKTQPLKEGQFTFQLRKTDDEQTVAATATNDDSGNITFQIPYQENELVEGKWDTMFDIRYWEEGKTDFTYRLVEMDGNEQGITYDSATYNVHVTVTHKCDLNWSGYGNPYYTDEVTITRNGRTVDQATFTNTLAGGAVDPDPDPGADLGEPAHRKYIQKNSDGTYTLSLNVTGGTTEWTDQTAEPIDIILLADTSGSMEGNRLRSLKTAANSLARSILTDENAALPAHQQIQLALARFSGYYRDETPSCLTNPNFTANYQTFSTAVNRLGANGATEWDSGLEFAQELFSSGRHNARKVVIFLSDGEPTTYSGYESNVYADALEIGNNMVENSMELYCVGIADSDMRWVKPGTRGKTTSTNSRRPTGYYRCMEAFAVDVNGGQGGTSSKYYSADNVDTLASIFEDIIQDIRHEKTYQDLTITDQLSTWADFVSTETSSVTVTNSDGQPLSAKDYSVAINGKNITVRFPNKLEAGETYTISFDIKPTQGAYDELAELKGIYPDTGDSNTDAEGNETSSRRPGFYSNETATLKYHVVTSTNGQDEVGEEKTAAYRKPVLQVELSQIQVEKKWEGTAPEDAEVEIALYQDGATQAYQRLTLTDEDNWTGVFNNLPSGHTYTVVEQPGAWTAKYESTVTPAKGISLPLGDTNEGTEPQSFTITNSLKSADFTFTKVDAADPDKMLPGAKFELWPATVTGEGADAVWEKKEGAEAITPIYPTGDRSTGTGEDGKAHFTDIPFGNYLLYEVKAPAGYKLPTDPVRVTVAPGMVTFYDVDGEQLDRIELPKGDVEDTSGEAATIPNKEQDELPVAGGMGAIWFTAGGLVLVGAAALLYFKQRKKGRE